MLALDARQPNSLIAACQAELRLVGERHKVLEVSAASLVVLAGRAQSLEGIVAHELQQGEARFVRLALRHEALVDERREPFQDGAPHSAHGFGRRERAPAREYAELCEEPLRVGVEQVVAPVERHAQRLLVARRVAAPAGEELEAVAEPRK